MAVSRIGVTVAGLSLFALAGWGAFAGRPPFTTRVVRFSVGVYEGAGPLALAPPAGRENPVISGVDLGTGLYQAADPFLIRRDSVWHLFFESVRGNRWTRSRSGGIIAHATSRDAIAWQFQGVVLDEPYHISYPHVFEWEGQYYMIPETRAARQVRLYRAAPFPERWELAKVLLEGPYADATPLRWDGRWWLFAERSTGKRNRSGNDTLRLFLAPELMGPWTEHPRSPIVAGDARAARPAGRMLLHEGRLYRFAQVDVPTYGRSVRAFEITRLTPTEYQERPAGRDPLLDASDGGWNAIGMHHVDAHEIAPGRWMAAVDGLSYDWALSDGS
jgi:hypothetical protein